MSFEIFTIPPFDKQLKALSKKYSSIKKDYDELLTELETDPLIGVAIGNQCRKLRMKISSKNKGESGGGRVIAYVAISKNSVYLLTIYDKSEKETVSEKEISALLKFIED